MKAFVTMVSGVVAMAGLTSAGLAAGAAFAAEPAPAPQPKPVDVKSLPANQWVERATSGLKGKSVTNGGGSAQGLARVAGLGIVAGDLSVGGKARILKLDSATGVWQELAAVDFNPAMSKAALMSPSRPVSEELHGLQLCHDSDRHMLVALPGGNGGINGYGRTVEFDLRDKKAGGFKPEPSPPEVTAASLCYDPVNKEVVLATGGFSEVGGTDGTWLYDGAKKQWRRLEGPKEVDVVRLPLLKAHDRLTTLRWLVWKDLEFRATGREALLDERSKPAALAAEAAAPAAEVKALGATAGANAAKAERPYHKSALASAEKLLAVAAGRLADLDARLTSGTPEELEVLYRGSIVPALEAVEKAVSELAVMPEPRMSARVVYDSQNKVMVCFGGNRQDGLWGDTWVYHCEGRWWERRRPAGHPPPQDARAVAYDPASGLVIVNFKWAYDAAANAWKELPLAGPKGAFWLEHDPAAGCLVALTQDLTNAWLLRLDAANAGLTEAKAAPDVDLKPIIGPYVLRDAATLADLKRWQGQMEAWSKALPPNTWGPAPTHGTGRPQGGRSWSSIVYDPDRRQILYRDGGHGSYHGAVTDHYDLPTGRWLRSDRRYEPPWPMGSYFGWGRSFSLAPWATHTYKYSLLYNPLIHRLQRVMLKASLTYDPDTGRWDPQLASTAHWTVDGPDPHTLVAVPAVPNGVVGVHSWGHFGTVLAKTTVIYQTATGIPKWEAGSTDATSRHRFCLFYDSKRNQVMFRGGDAAGKKEMTLWAMPLTEGAKFARVPYNVVGDKGDPHFGREVVYVPRHDLFLFMGQGYDPPVVIALDPNTWTFRTLSIRVSKESEGKVLSDTVQSGLQYDPVGDVCYFIALHGRAMQAFRYVPEKAAEKQKEPAP